MKIDGRCHCGTISYEAEVDPEKVYACHCTDCQAISGSPYRWSTTIPEADFKLLSGELKFYAKKTDSGVTNRQHFCPTCASPIYSTSLREGPSFFNVRLGTARQRDQLPPRMELWCGSGQRWAAVQAETKKFEKE